MGSSRKKHRKARKIDDNDLFSLATPLEIKKTILWASIFEILLQDSNPQLLQAVIFIKYRFHLTCQQVRVGSYNISYLYLSSSQ